MLHAIAKFQKFLNFDERFCSKSFYEDEEALI